MATFLVAAGAGAFSLMDDPQPVGADPVSSKPLVAMALPILPSTATAPVSAPQTILAVSSTSAGAAGQVTVVPAPAASVQDPHKLTGRWAMQLSMMLMNQGIEKFSRVPYYKAKFFKQEVVKGALLEGQEIDLKMGHAPFSVYMKFRSGDKGRQAIYVDGQHENNLLVQPGGVAGRLAGTLKLAIDSDMVMAENRHPVTQVGLIELARTIAGEQLKDLQNNHAFECELVDNATFEDRPSFRCTITFPAPLAGKDYRKADFHIDKELLLPVCVRNYAWGPKGEKLSDEESMIEHYAYTEIEAGEEVLSSNDFDPKNKKYYMRMK